MQQVTDIQEVKADLAGDLAVELSSILPMTETLAEHYHNTGKLIAAHLGDYTDCSNTLCMANRQRIERARAMLSRGV